jgi:hypothetical protein
MDEAQLQAQHPELYSAVFKKGETKGKTDAEEAAAKAAADEKDRIEAHLVMGETTGDMKLAVESIRKGDKMTQTLSAKYLVAGMRKGAVDARAEDDKVAADATDKPAAGADRGKTKKELVADAVTRAFSGEEAASA